MLGVSTFCLHDRPLDEVLEVLSGITDTVEVMNEARHTLRSHEVLESFSYSYSIHAPARGINIASLHEAVRKACVDVLIESFRVAAEVSGTVVVHPGYFAWEVEREESLIAFKRSLSELSVAAGDLGVRYFVENMGNWEYFFIRFPEELPIIGDAGFALDVGHANLNGNLDAFLGLLIGHVHLHDNRGDTDTHLAVGEGTVPFRKVMEAVRKNRAVPIIEVATYEGTLASITKLESLG
jgi:sugar phosphate isomerase/epimerase